MKKPLSLAVACVLVASTVSLAQAQAPTKTPAASTPEQDAAIQAGIELHDKQQYDEAIAKYQEVLKGNPDNITALYELAFSNMEKKDDAQAREVARRGLQYSSELLPDFYVMIASIYENQDKTDQALATYRQGLAVLPKSGALYYNMAVTYRQSLKDPATARQTMKQAIVVDPEYADAPLLLGQWFQMEGYRTQAFLSVSRSLVIDPSAQAYALWRQILKGPDDPMADGAMQDADMRAARPAVKIVPAKTDEGDFTAIDTMFLPGQQTLEEAKADGTPEIEALVTEVDALLGVIANAPPQKRPAFVSQQFVPFFAAMKQKNYVEPFVYWAAQRSRLPGVRDWLKANEAKVKEFAGWAEAYKMPTTPVPGAAPAAAPAKK